MEISFEPATLSDAEALVAVQIAAFHHDSVLYPEVAIGGPPGYDSVEATTKKLQEGICYKMVDAGRIIGGMVVYDMGDGHMHLDLIFIDPAYHNRGIGTQALHVLERAHPAQYWTLDTPLWALRNQHFYEKFGYVRYNEQIFPDIILFGYEKRLSPSKSIN